MNPMRYVFAELGRLQAKNLVQQEKTTEILHANKLRRDVWNAIFMPHAAIRTKLEKLV